MDTATTVTLILAIATGVPALALEVPRIGLPRPRIPRKLGVLLAVVLMLRLVPVEAATAPPGERIESSDSLDPLPTDVDGVAPAPPTGESDYVVRPGDSLWAIACRELSADGGEPSSAEIDRYWKKIYSRNLSVVGADPNLIFPGQLLLLPSPK